MTIEERAKTAADYKANGVCNCCQAVARVFSDKVKIGEESLMQLSSGFMGGMGCMEATCGALIGAGMIAGLKTEGKGTLRYTRQIQEAFRDRCGAIKCKDLKTVTDGKVLCPCEDCVRNAVEIYGEVMGLD